MLDGSAPPRKARRPPSADGFSVLHALHGARSARRAANARELTEAPSAMLECAVGRGLTASAGARQELPSSRRRWRPLGIAAPRRRRLKARRRAVGRDARLRQRRRPSSSDGSTCIATRGISAVTAGFAERRVVERVDADAAVDDGGGGAERQAELRFEAGRRTIVDQDRRRDRDRRRSRSARRRRR